MSRSDIRLVTNIYLGAELIRQLLDKGLRAPGDEEFDLAAIKSTAGAVPTARPVRPCRG